MNCHIYMTEYHSRPVRSFWLFSFVLSPSLSGQGCVCMYDFLGRPQEKSEIRIQYLFMKKMYQIISFNLVVLLSHVFLKQYGCSEIPTGCWDIRERICASLLVCYKSRLAYKFVTLHQLWIKKLQYCLHKVRKKTQCTDIIRKNTV